MNVEATNQADKLNGENWFEIMFGKCQDGCLTVNHNEPGKTAVNKTQWFHVTELDKAKDAAREISRRGLNAYFGLGLRENELAKGRGEKKDIICITSFWADIDVFNPIAHTKKALPQTFEEAIELANSFPLKPSILINSGNGLHAYWLLKEPCYFKDEADRKKVAQLMERFQRILNNNGREKGWNLDNTSDLARILRVPGTKNFKDKQKPKEVVVLEYYPENQYALEQFEPYLGLPSEPCFEASCAVSHCQGNVQKIVDHCAFIQHCRDNAKTLSEPEWFAMNSNLCPAQGGKELIHEFSRPYAKYTQEETDAKIEQCLENGETKDIGPHTCEYIQDTLNFKGCPSGGCGVKAPVVIATSAVFDIIPILEELEASIRENPKLIYKMEYIKAFAVLKDQDKAKYDLAFAKIVCESKVLKQSNIKLLEKSIDDELRKIYKNKIDNVFKDIGYDFTSPENWLVSENGIYKWTKDGKMRVCPIPVAISKRLQNIDDGTEKVEITFKRDNKWKTVRVPRSTVASNSKIIELANHGLFVTTETSKDLVNYLSDVEAYNKDIPIVKMVNRLGWINDKEFVPYLSDIILDVDGGNAQLGSAFTALGTLEDWTELMAPLRATHIGKFILAAGFGAPMMKLLGQRIFAVHIWGNSRAGKSAAAKAALSVWANPQEGMMTFNSTRVGLEQKVGFLSNLPLVIDEKQIVAGNQNFVESLVYMLGEGKGKTRGRKNGGLADSTSWQTLAITTGETPIANDSSATGIKSRVLELNPTNIIPENYGSELHQRLESTHGVAGEKFIKHLVEYPREKLKEDYECVLKKIRQGFPELLGSHPGALALIAVADMYSSQWIFNETEEKAVTQAIQMVQAIANMLETRSDADEARRSARHIKDWIQMNNRCFKEEGSYSYGWEIDEGRTSYIVAGVFKRACLEGGFNPMRVRSDFKEHQWLIARKNKSGDMVDYGSKRAPNDRTVGVYELCLPQEL